MKTSVSVLWRRLDTAGHDACRLEQTAVGWRVSGTAAFRHEGGAAQLVYEAACDRAWRSQEGRVHGWLGPELLDFTIWRTTEGSWMLNGASVPGLAECVDLDFSFTPATNLFQIRRMGLVQGQAVDATAAWLDVPTATLAILPQRYERRGETTYRYEAPTLGYEADLEVTSMGVVRHYPGLWVLEE
jgi:hypothetical protein